MSHLQLPLSAGGERFPGFEVLAQSDHWDDATRSVIMQRVVAPPAIRFFTDREEATARSLFDQLLDQHEEPKVPVINMVDHRLMLDETDGWHYEGMPKDSESWKISLANLNLDSLSRSGVDFHEAGHDQQAELLQAILDLGTADWHGYPAARVWSLWTRYACTAFYSHPEAWDEIGFAGPAYPRGYKNLGVNRREPFEVADAHPTEDPLREDDA